MKSSREVRLGLEVLEDRMTPSGAFGGPIDAGIPLFTPFNSWMLQPATTVGQSPQAIQSAMANFYSPSYFLNQVQSYQVAQMALIDQLFSNMQSLLQALQPTIAIP